MDTFEKIRALLAEQLDIDPAKITMESDIMSDFEADSLDIVDMVMTLEDEFGIEVPMQAKWTVYILTHPITPVPATGNITTITSTAPTPIVTPNGSPSWSVASSSPSSCSIPTIPYLSSQSMRKNT